MTAIELIEEGVEPVDVSVTCCVCKETKEINLVPDDYLAYMKTRTPEYEGPRVFIQDALPSLSSSERELLMTRTCSDCWDKMFPNLD